MYPIYDKKSAIREVQNYLFKIAHVVDYLPHTPIDGIYGEQTREAVKLYQGKNGLAETGETDYLTFTLLYNDYLQSEKKLADKRHHTLKKGDQGDDVAHLHNILRRLSKRYPTIRRVPNTSFFSDETERNVREMQRILILEPNGIADARFQSRLELELNHDPAF